MKKDSPLSKVYEAISALADERVLKKDEETYLVTSSDYAKSYTVKVSGLTFSSNDNATLWQHYAGYPIIAVLISRGAIGAPRALYGDFTGINWKALNTKHKNDYDLAIEEFLSSKSPETRKNIENKCQEILTLVNALDLEIKGNRQKILPPLEKSHT